MINAAAPHPTAEKLGVVLGVGAAVQAIHEDLIAQHLLRAFS
jgi:hypothetical protein